MDLPTCFHTDDCVLNIFHFFVGSIPLLAPPCPSLRQLTSASGASSCAWPIGGPGRGSEVGRQIGGAWFLPPAASLWGPGRGGGGVSTSLPNPQLLPGTLPQLQPSL